MPMTSSPLPAFQYTGIPSSCVRTVPHPVPHTGQWQHVSDGGAGGAGGTWEAAPVGARARSVDATCTRSADGTGEAAGCEKNRRYTSPGRAMYRIWLAIPVLSGDAGPEGGSAGPWGGGTRALV